jgi:hypothetical protein
MEIVDYAYPAMMAEMALRDMHNAMLENKFDEALEHAMKAIVETRITHHSITHMKEQHEAQIHKRNDSQKT